MTNGYMFRVSEEVHVEKAVSQNRLNNACSRDIRRCQESSVSVWRQGLCGDVADTDNADSLRDPAIAFEKQRHAA